MKSKIQSFILPASIVISGIALLYFISTINFLLFHCISEIICIIIGISIFIFTFNLRKKINNNFLMIIGIAYLFTGIINLLHTLSYKGMGVFTNQGANISTQLWIANQYLTAISFFIGALLLNKKIKLKYIFSFYSLITLVVISSIFFIKVFPLCFIEGIGLTSFKIVSEYIISFILIGSAVLLFNKRKFLSKRLFYLIIAAIIATILSEISFTFYISVYGFSNVIGHLLKILSIYFIYSSILETGLMKPDEILLLKLKKRDNDLIESEARFKKMIKKSPLPMIITRSNREIEFFNDKFTEIFGYSLKDIPNVDKLCEICFPDKVSRKKAEKILIPSITTNGKNNTDIEMHDWFITAMDGTKRDCEFYSVPIGDSLLLIIEDITERKKHIKEIKLARETAEKASQIKSKFLAGMSHELRTPMTAIIGIIDMIVKYDSENLTEDQREGLEMVGKSSKRLLSMINDLLDLSKIEAGKMNIRLNKFSLNDIVTAVKSSISMLIKIPNIKLNIHIDKEVPDIIISDSKKIQQILFNLLGNSVKFTEKGSISLKIYLRRDLLFFEVKDTGIGIEKKYLKSMFEEFNQIENRNYKNVTGTGLGLALTKKMIEILGGNISAESEPGKGTLIKFFIPFIPVDIDTNKSLVPIYKPNTDNDQRESSLTSDKLQMDNKKSSHTILIADDEEESLFTTKLMLKNKFNLITAKNGQEAIATAISACPDLILMDINMPDITGKEAFNIIRKKINKRIPIIAYTALAMKGDREDLISHGFDEYLSKPVDPVLLNKTIFRILKKKNE